ncbi:MAG: uroporphyrinogen decarboxylase family protein [Armatimonadia bacterium]
MTPRDRMLRAIRFDSPDRPPLEIHDVPHLYDAYGTLHPAAARPGAADYDGIRVTYHWTFDELGTNDRGERLRRDEWGCVQRVPSDLSTAYEVIEKPLVDPRAFSGYRFPDPTVSDPFFDRTQGLIRQHYPDKFVCGYVDPGPLLVAFNLMGYEGLLMRLHDDLPQVLEIMRGIVEYQKGIVDRWAALGVPMVSIIDEFAGTDGLMFSPKLWRQHFLPLYDELFRHIQSHGMLCGCLFDGDIVAIMDDYVAIGPDVVEIMQPNLLGIEQWGQRLRGKVCAKASVDMMTTLASGSPAACAAEARKLVETFHTPEGGFIGISLRWHRPEYPEANVAAVGEALRSFT